MKRENDIQNSSGKVHFSVFAYNLRLSFIIYLWFNSFVDISQCIAQNSLLIQTKLYDQ